jgi:hypothetical protein
MIMRRVLKKPNPGGRRAKSNHAPQLLHQPPLYRVSRNVI